MLRNNMPNQTNTEALRQRFPHLPLQVGDVPIDDGFKISPSRSGQPSLSIDRLAIHSSYDPLKEAQNDLERIQNSVDAIVLAGFGLGYLALQIVSQRPHVALIIIEPSLSYLRLAQAGIDLRLLYAHPKLAIITQEDPLVLIDLLLDWQVSTPHWHDLRPRVQLSPDLFGGYRDVFTDYHNRQRANQLAITQYGLLWWRNSLKNLPLWPVAKPISSLFALAKDLPVLVVAAGPSLSHHLEDLQKLRNRMFMICVETAARILLAADIRPDIIISIDSQFWNARHLDHLDLSGIAYVADSAVHPMMMKKIDREQLYLMSPLLPMLQPLEQALGKFGSIRSGGSVMTSAWDLALKLQPSSIWCIGCDFAYPQQHTHAKGALFEGWMHASSYRLQTFLTSQYSLRHQQSILVENHFGEHIASDSRMQLYHRWLEEALQQAPIASYNLSSLGASIAGMPYRSMHDACALPPCREQITQRWQNLQAKPMACLPNYASGFRVALTSYLDTLENFRIALEQSDKLHIDQLQDHAAIQLFAPILPAWLRELATAEAGDFARHQHNMLSQLQQLLTLADALSLR
jgi:hypothetical protein